MKSMTGYGGGEAISDQIKVIVEMASVNRKQSDIVVNLPRSLTDLEAQIKKAVFEGVPRGRVTVQVQVENLANSHTSLSVDEHLADSYFQAFQRLSKRWRQELELQPADLLRAPGVFNVQETEIDSGSIAPLIDEAVGKALVQLLSMQTTEGASLKKDLQQRLGALESMVEEMLQRAPQVKDAYRAQLHRRLKEADIQVSFEDERFLKEVGIFAERTDISEELTRLQSHFSQFATYFDCGDPCGRPLDFLCQEVNREFNTIGSKANDAVIAQRVVEAKAEVEKIREQVQNVQ